MKFKKTRREKIKILIKIVMIIIDIEMISKEVNHIIMEAGINMNIVVIKDSKDDYDSCPFIYIYYS